MTERSFIPALALAVSLGCADSRAAAPDPDSIARGRRIFHDGQTARGELLGRIGADGVELRGAMVACARCHGAHAEGRPGGEAAPSIRARVLFASVDHGTERPAYDEASLGRAVREGRSAAGRSLSWIMPRFDLAPGELADVRAYLQVVGEERDPGVSAEQLVVGSALPLSGPLRDTGEDVRRVLDAAFADVNARGGLFGRKLVLRVDDVTTGDATARLLDAGVFALVASMRPDAPASDARLETERVPLVGPVTPSESGTEEHPAIFWTQPGAAAQARWAVQQLAREDAGAPFAIVASVKGREWADAAADEALRWNVPAPTRLAPFAELPTGVRTVLFAGDADELAWLTARLPHHVTIIAPADHARAPAQGLDRVRFVHPGGGFDLAPFRRFLARHGVAERNLAVQASAWASARVLVEALRAAGAEPTRAQLVSALESLRDLETGVSPPLTFGPHRHLGVAGARFARRDPANAELVPVTPWRSLVLR